MTVFQNVSAINVEVLQGKRRVISVKHKSALKGFFSILGQPIQIKKIQNEPNSSIKIDSKYRNCWFIHFTFKYTVKKPISTIMCYQFSL